MHRLCVLILALASLGLASCASRSPKPGQALIEIDTDKIYSGRVGKPCFVSHNGKKLKQKPKYLHLSPGHHEIDLSYRFTGHSAMTTTLPLDAKAGRTYQVRFDLIPKLVGDAPLGHGPWVTPNLMPSAGGDPITAMVILASGATELTTRAVGSGAHNVSGHYKSVRSATIDVISDKLDEGIVHRTNFPE